MKTNRVIAYLVPLAFFVATISASAADAARTHKLTDAAHAAVEQLKHGDFDRVEAQFDAKMSEALPLAKLTSTWQDITQQIGAIGNCQDATTSEHDGYFVVLLPCDAANTPINAQFVYDADNKIAGMFFRPRTAPAG